jgi:hypothetical protein
MNPSDAAQCLARAAAFDRRTVGEVEARAWAEAFPTDYRTDEVVRAIVAHYRASTDFLMPKHVIDAVTAERAANRKRYMSENFNAVPDVDPDDVDAWLAALRRGELVDRSPKSDAPDRRTSVNALVASTLARRPIADVPTTETNRETA